MTDTLTDIIRRQIGELADVDPSAIKDDQPLFYHASTQRHADAIAQGSLGLDSLDRVELAMWCEEEFHIDIPDSVSQDMGTIRDIVEALQALGVSDAPAIG